MDISEIRKANLLKLIEDKAAGSQKDFAYLVGTSPAYLSQIINGTIGRNGKPAVVGTAMARKIEKALDLQHGVFDLPLMNLKYSSALFFKSAGNGKSKAALFGQQYLNDFELDNNVDISNKINIDGRPVPVISWAAAGSFSSIETVIKDTEVDEYLPPNKDCGKNGYGLIVVGNSMSPDFKPDDRIYVNPDIQSFDLKTGDLVIVACNGDTEATFKKLIIESGEQYLQPLNPNWPEQIIKLTEGCNLVGRVVGLYRKI